MHRLSDGFISRVTHWQKSMMESLAQMEGHNLFYFFIHILPLDCLHVCKGVYYIRYDSVKSAFEFKVILQDYIRWNFPADHAMIKG